MRATPEERFWAKVEKTEGCWLWLAGVNKKTRYGVFGVAGKQWLAHRYSFHLTGQILVPGLQLDHLCRVRHCVNPAHLEQVTPRINTLRGMTLPAANLRKTECLRGHLFNAANTYFKGTRRVCRACKNAAEVRRVQARRCEQEKASA